MFVDKICDYNFVLSLEVYELIDFLLINIYFPLFGFIFKLFSNNNFLFYIYIFICSYILYDLNKKFPSRFFLVKIKFLKFNEKHYDLRLDTFGVELYAV